ncbi:MAG TPA: hypothetical protein VGS19_32155 [Streptosporangiaceae bacterium]|nr:hypothetical protein [Streptosporangiaceae bacterium]
MTSALSARAVLEHLAAHLGPQDYATVLVSGDGCAPCLTVTSRPTQMSLNVFVAEGWYCTAPPFQIAHTSNPAAAARHIAGTLSGTAAASLAF